MLFKCENIGDFKLSNSFLLNNLFLESEIYNAIYGGIFNKEQNVSLYSYACADGEYIREPEYLMDPNAYVKIRDFKEYVQESYNIVSGILDNIKNIGIIKNYKIKKCFNNENDIVINDKLYFKSNDPFADPNYLLFYDLRNLEDKIIEMYDFEFGPRLFRYNIDMDINSAFINSTDTLYNKDNIANSFIDKDTLKLLSIYIDILNSGLIKKIDLNEYYGVCRIKIKITEDDFSEDKYTIPAARVEDLSLKKMINRMNEYLSSVMALPSFIGDNVMIFDFNYKEVLMRNFYAFKNAINDIAPVQYRIGFINIVLSEEKGIYILGADDRCYKIKQNSNRFKILSIINSHDYISASKICSEIWGNNPDFSLLSKEIKEINENIKQHLGISIKVIEHDNSSGYYINKGINIIL